MGIEFMGCYQFLSLYFSMSYTQQEQQVPLRQPVETREKGALACHGPSLSWAPTAMPVLRGDRSSPDGPFPRLQLHRPLCCWEFGVRDLHLGIYQA